MIDTIILTKRVSEVEPNILQNIKRMLDQQIIKRQDGNDSESVFGYIKSLRVSIDSCYVKIFGSLNVFFKGSNVKRVSFEEIYDGITAFSKWLGVDLFSFKVTRIDIGFNFVSTQSIGELIESIVEVPKLKCYPYKDGIYYKNGSRTLTFYDKKKERGMKANLPPAFNSFYLLRVEYRYAKNDVISKRLKRNNATFQDLIENIVILIEDFHTTFKSIVWNSKAITYTFLRENVNDLKSFRRFLMAQGLEKMGGVEEAYKVIDDIKDQAKYYSIIKGMKEIIDDLCNININSEYKTNYSKFLDGIELGIGYEKLKYFDFLSRYNVFKCN